MTIEERIIAYAEGVGTFRSRDVIEALDLNPCNTTRKLKVMCEKKDPVICRVLDDAVNPSKFVYSIIHKEAVK
jgi:hypothetical protein